jgi:hypothetical protein
MCKCRPICRTCDELATVQGLRVVNQAMDRLGGIAYDLRVDFVCPSCRRRWRCTTSTSEEENQVVTAFRRGNHY